MPRDPRLRRLSVLLAIGLLFAAGLVLVRRRAAGLPAVELPVLLWAAVAPEPSDPATVAKDAFIDQISDLWSGGFETPSPRRLRQRAAWGRPLPDAPVLLRFGAPLASLVEPDGVESILEGAGFSALVDLPCEEVEAGAPGLLSWEQVRAADARGTLRFAPCVSARPGAALPLEGAVELYRERTGRRPDAVAVRAGDPAVPPPCDIALSDRPPAVGWRGRRQPFLGATPVLGGRHAFAMQLRQDATDPALFGTLAVSHPAGSNPPPDGRPFVLLLYQKDDPMPIVDETLAEEGADGSARPAAPDETVEIPVPAAPRFPLEACVYDQTRTVLYFRRKFFRNEAVRDPSWRPPVLDPDERLEIEPL